MSRSPGWRMATASASSAPPMVRRWRSRACARCSIRAASASPATAIPAASYAVLDLDAAELRWHRVAYDIAAVQAAMRAVDLPVRLVERLAFGQ